MVRGSRQDFQRGKGQGLFPVGKAAADPQSVDRVPEGIENLLLGTVPQLPQGRQQGLYGGQIPEILQLQLLRDLMQQVIHGVMGRNVHAKREGERQRLRQKGLQVGGGGAVQGGIRKQQQQRPDTAHARRCTRLQRKQLLRADGAAPLPGGALRFQLTESVQHKQHALMLHRQVDPLLLAKLQQADIPEAGDGDGVAGGVPIKACRCHKRYPPSPDAHTAHGIPTAAGRIASERPWNNGCRRKSRCGRQFPQSAAMWTAAA